MRNEKPSTRAPGLAQIFFRLSSSAVPAPFLYRFRTILFGLACNDNSNNVIGTPFGKGLSDCDSWRGNKLRAWACRGRKPSLSIGETLDHTDRRGSQHPIIFRFGARANYKRYKERETGAGDPSHDLDAPRRGWVSLPCMVTLDGRNGHVDRLNMKKYLLFSGAALIALAALFLVANNFTPSFRSCINQTSAGSTNTVELVVDTVRTQSICIIGLVDQHSGLFAAIAAFMLAWFTFALKQSSTALWKIEDRNFREAQRAFVSGRVGLHAIWSARSNVCPSTRFVHAHAWREVPRARLCGAGRYRRARASISTATGCARPDVSNAVAAILLRAVSASHRARQHGELPSRRRGSFSVRFRLPGFFACRASYKF